MTIYFLISYKPEHNAMWNKTKQRSRRSSGNASFTGSEENNIEPLLQSSQDLRFCEIVSQYTLTLLHESFAIDYSWKLSKVGFEWIRFNLDK